MSASSRNDIFYSLPEVWDFCLEKIYDKPEYVGGLVDVMAARGIGTGAKILDAGCGSGFPALDLVERGYRLIATDKSSEMVRQIGVNAKKRHLAIETRHVTWAELAQSFGEKAFDFVYCRGNSLVYAASWEQNWIVPNRSREEIQTALHNFYKVLKPGGTLYVDVTNKDEKPHEERIGVVETAHGPVELTWKIEHDTVHKIRAWTMHLKFEDTGQVKTYPSYSYLLSNDELAGFISTAGFSKVEADVPVRGENNYNVFLARK